MSARVMGENRHPFNWWRERVEIWLLVVDIQSGIEEIPSLVNLPDRVEANVLAHRGKPSGLLSTSARN